MCIFFIRMFQSNMTGNTIMTMKGMAKYAYTCKEKKMKQFLCSVLLLLTVTNSKSFDNVTSLNGLGFESFVNAMNLGGRTKIYEPVLVVPLEKEKINKTSFSIRYDMDWPIDGGYVASFMFQTGEETYKTISFHLGKSAKENGNSFNAVGFIESWNNRTQKVEFEKILLFFSLNSSEIQHSLNVSIDKNSTDCGNMLIFSQTFYQGADLRETSHETCVDNNMITPIAASLFRSVAYPSLPTLTISLRGMLLRTNESPYVDTSGFSITSLFNDQSLSIIARPVSSKC